jgi:2-oxoglutarate dehydrogenase E2 component (dihydrolipoamide succinyltransferase)
LVDVLLPSLGESVTEGIVLRWMKNIGDHVDRDEPICEISTDKVDSEMPSPAAGILTQILAQEGDTVEVGARLGVIDENASASVTSPTTAANVASTSKPEAPSSVVAPASEPTVVPIAAAPPSKEPAGVLASPVVRRILNDGGVDARTVTGSGPGGTITRRDAEAAVANGPTDDVSVPLSNGRRRMAEHMVESASSTPQGFVAIEVFAEVFGRLASSDATTTDGATIADEVLVALAAARALGEFPALNATFAGDEIVEHRTINLGFARPAARDGMLVPVVHAAAGLTVRALARRLADLSERLANRQLTTDDLMGGTFTVMGSPSAHAVIVKPLIIPPEVAILSLGSPRQVPVVREGQFAVGWTVTLGLTFDHRVCDATYAASYLERVAQLLNAIDIDAER